MSEPRPGQPPLVALVDDEEDITTFLAIALEDAGYRVVATNESAVALALLRERRPDLICLDLLMPERMGASLYLQIRRAEELAAVPVLILSGLGTRDDLRELLARTGDVPPPTGYIEKPVDREDFLSAVERALADAAGPGRGGAP
jgi:DNA-binding response OmpR family regulator